MNWSLKLLRPVCAVLAALLLPEAPARAAAPSQLLNKSVFVSFNIAVPSQGSDGSSHNSSRISERVIYISSQGRVFTRVTRKAGRNSEMKEAGPETARLNFVGNSLVGVMQMISGASQLTVSFDPSFQSCTAKVIAGGENGKAIVYKGLNGVTYTATGKAQISGESCSIRDGNALAD